MTNCRDMAYHNAGNLPLLDLVSASASRVLDVGCGAGDNARVLAERQSMDVFGITVSPSEAELAGRHMKACWVADLEADSLSFLSEHRFDCVILSHVLEHLADPVAVLRKITPFVERGGQVLIAVPNVLNWRYRARMVVGRFDYEEAGVLDRTHLRFFTVDSAPRELVDPIEELEIVHRGAEGSVPLWLLRRHMLPRTSSQRLDALGVRAWPGLFAAQILLSCRRR